MSNNFLVRNDVLYINNIDTNHLVINVYRGDGGHYDALIVFNFKEKSLKYRDIKKIVMNGCKVTNAVFYFGETEEPINISFNATKIEYTLMLSTYKLLISEDSYVKNIVLPNESDYCDHYDAYMFYVTTYVRLNRTLFIIENVETKKNEVISFLDNESSDLTNFKNVLPHIF